jgi:pimeloyl-ACP methyl ester carboxylesterase
MEGVVLIPGMLCDRRLFAPQVDALARELPVHVADIPPLGSIDAMAADILSDIPFERFGVAGLSMGGIVALRMLLMAGERIERLALLDTTHLADAPERRNVRNRQIEAVEAGNLHRVFEEEMLPAYLAHANAQDAELLETLRSMARDAGPQAFVQQSIALRDRQSGEQALAGYSGPLLLLVGSEDRLCTPARHREMAALCPSSRLSIIEDAGHITTLERPAVVTGLLRDWLTWSR